MRIIHGQDMHQQIKGALDTIRTTVCQTLGAGGRKVIISKIHAQNGQIIGRESVPTKDGISVCHHIAIDTDGILQKVADMLYKSVTRQWKDVKDGTTTATLMCCTFYDLMYNELQSNPNINVHQLADKYKGYAETIIKGLEKQKKQVTTVDELVKIATISANNDPILGKIVGETVWKVGQYGETQIVYSENTGIEVHITEGYIIPECADQYWIAIQNCGYEFEQQSPRLVLTTDRIDNIKEHIFPLMKAIDLELKEGSTSPVIVVCHGISQECAKVISSNNDIRVKNGVQPYPILFIEHDKSDATEKREFMEDLAMLSGAKILSRELNATPFSKFNVSHFGDKLKSVTSSMQRSVLVFDKDNIKTEYIKIIKEELEDENIEKERKEWLSKRLAYFNGAIAKIKVGGVTSGEQSNNDDFADDSVGNTHNALKHGYLLGGGLSLANVLNTQKSTEHISIQDICLAPMEQMAVNSSISLDPLLGVSDPNIGIDFFTGKLIDYDKAGIYDSFLSQVTAIKVGCAFACQLIQSQSMFIE